MTHQGKDQELIENLDTRHQGPPCAEEESKEQDDAVEGELLEGQAKSVYQTQAARANYLCLDRPDIGFATKEAMRRLSCPTTEDETALKKIGRFLLGKQRLVSLFRYNCGGGEIVVESDSDHAGCTKTRKSTSGGVIRWGGYVLKWWSKTQATIALSSGEAELAALIRATSEGLGM